MTNRYVSIHDPDNPGASTTSSTLESSVSTRQWTTTHREAEIHEPASDTHYYLSVSSAPNDEYVTVALNTVGPTGDLTAVFRREMTKDTATAITKALADLLIAAEEDAA